ncbi:MAG: RluA family pseudouridine synthase [Clostridiaceae bacterium]|jgi:23S rRNA pseudouridine1911/1915/1917 synthase|nr:RluA family pseudouridine synthase [Clostridiaceae bacterium]
MEIKMLYEDNHLLVAVKPPGVPVQADSSGAGDLLNYLKDYIKKKYNKPGNVYLGLVHRLDRNAGGVMVFARTSKAASRLSDQVRRRLAEKTYLAVVHGCPDNKQGHLVHYLIKDRKNNRVSVVDADTPGSREAVLDYEVLESREGLSLVKVELETGRSHQVRVQMAELGTPLYGDVKYRGLGERNRNDLALWSWRMEVEHPVKKEKMVFTAPPPGSHPWSLFNIPSC